MTQDEIVKLAREAAGGMLSYDGEGNWRLSESEVERFAALVAAAEREACAKVCDEREEIFQKYYIRGLPGQCASAIRARGQA